MARRVTIPSTEYAPGNYEASVDSFLPNTDTLTISMSREAWPGTPSDSVAKIYILWSDGSGINGAELPGGTVLNRDGSVMTHQRLSVGIPFEADGSGGRRKRNVISGTFRLEVLQALRTEIVAEAK